MFATTDDIMFTETIIVGSAFNQQSILLVDDNEDDLLIMRNSFAQAGIPNPIQSVEDGEEAIAYLKGEGVYSDRNRHPFPVVIFLDLNMPKKNGLEVLTWIRQQPSLKNLTVHILTASSRSVDVENAFKLGANSYLIKPSRVQALVGVLKAWHTMALSSAFPLHRQPVPA
jgi:CheY-like chemotaxis protein